MKKFKYVYSKNETYIFKCENCGMYLKVKNYGEALTHKCKYLKWDEIDDYIIV